MVSITITVTITITITICLPLHLVVRHSLCLPLPLPATLSTEKDHEQTTVFQTGPPPKDFIKKNKKLFLYLLIPVSAEAIHVEAVGNY